MKKDPVNRRKVKAGLDWQGWQGLAPPREPGFTLVWSEPFGGEGRVNPKEIWVCNKSSSQRGRQILGVS